MWKRSAKRARSSEQSPPIDAAQVARQARKHGLQLDSDPALLDLLINAGEPAELPNEVAQLTMAVLATLGEIVDDVHRRGLPPSETPRQR